MLNDSQMAGIWQYFPEKYFLFKICNDCKEAICVSKVLNLLVTGGNKKAKYIYQLSAAGFTKYRWSYMKGLKLMNHSISNVG